MKEIIKPVLILLIVVSANSCASRKTFVQTELYFGLSQNDGNMISDSAWNVFVNRNVSNVFSEGFTVIHSEGKWVDKEHKQLHSEPSRIVTSVSTMSPTLSASIDSLREKYKALFLQESVLRIDKKAHINF